MESGELIAPDFPQRLAPQLEFLLHLSVPFGEPIEIRSPSDPPLDICYFKSGAFAGSRLSGELLCGGGDWAIYRTAGCIDIDARAILQLAAGEPAYLKYSGVWRAPAGMLAKVLAPGGVRHFAPADHYIRVHARFQTGSERHSWLNGLIALGIGRLDSDDAIGYDFYEIK